MTYQDKNTDEFDNLFKQKLNNYEMSPKEDLWSNIESEIQSRKKRLPIFAWISSGAAIALILLGLFLPKSFDKTQLKPSELAKQVTTETKEKENTTLPIVLDENPVKTQADLPKSATTREKTKFVPKKTSEQISNDLLSKAIVEQKENVEAGKEIITKSDDIVVFTEEKSNKSEKRASYDQLFPKEEIQQETQNILKKTKKQKNNNQWQLAANYGTNAGTTAKNSDFSLQNPAYSKWTEAVSSTGSSNPNNTIYSQAVLVPEDFSEKTHMLPLSFGFMLRKNLTNMLSLESGLNYTYLQTKLNHNSINRYDGKIELHYLGIPINLIMKFFDKPKWEIYASAGGMIEKGLQSKFSQNIYLDDQVFPNVQKENIKGVQLSVNAALGVSYNIYDDFGIYIEPRISYFFDNNQPFSIRSEHPVTFGLNIGLKYDL